MGSEMCIRDSTSAECLWRRAGPAFLPRRIEVLPLCSRRPTQKAAAALVLAPAALPMLIGNTAFGRGQGGPAAVTSGPRVPA